MIKAVIFDFDGTLINTNELIKTGLNQFAINHMGRVLTDIELMNLNGKHLKDQIGYMVKGNLEAEIETFKTWYNHHHDTYATTFRGIPELLEILKYENITMGIVTNNSRVPLKKGLQHLNFTGYFESLVTSDDVATPKPNPEGIHIILDQLQVKPDEVIFVGDSPSDINAAKKANVTSCLVDWTILSDLEKHVLSPDYIIRSPLEILGVIKDINVKRIKATPLPMFAAK